MRPEEWWARGCVHAAHAQGQRQQRTDSVRRQQAPARARVSLRGRLPRAERGLVEQRGEALRETAARPRLRHVRVRDGDEVGEAAHHGRHEGRLFIRT